MNNDGFFEIALFPIPGSVSFPQTIVPLHVFEPRYRQMIEDCISQNKLLGVCHTKTVERFAPSQKKQVQSKEELYQIYRQNLSTFSPQDIFSAGPLEITETTEDGRYHIAIHMLKRFRILNIIQDKPYKIAKCEQYDDTVMIDLAEASELIQKQRETILSFIESQLIHLGDAVIKELDDIKRESSLNSLTFKLFRFFRMSELQMQEILNSTDPRERLEQIYQFVKKLKTQK